jgi:hypothetical protein
MYALAGVAVFEAGVQAWTLKRVYQTIRPGEYIPMFRLNETLKSQYVGPYCPNADIPGWKWIPYQLLTLNTPPFPEWPSGHSSFSSAVMAVMVKRFLGGCLFVFNSLTGPVYWFQPTASSSQLPLQGWKSRIQVWH